MSGFLSKLAAGVEAIGEGFADAVALREDSAGIHPCPALLYEWDHTSVSPLAMVKFPPPCDFPSLNWALATAETILESQANAFEIEASAETRQEIEGHMALLREGVRKREVSIPLLETIVQGAATFAVVKGAADRPRSIDEYNQLFRLIALPPIAKDYTSDDTFAHHRTAGPNPLMIRRIRTMPENFPLPEAQFRQVLPDDSLAAALAEGRAYLCDYEMLADIVVDPTYLPVKYHYAPMAFFTAHKTTGALIPVAIQTQQKPDGLNLFLADGTPNWMIAKTIVQMADTNVHQAVSHLGRTHFLIEPFIVATARTLGREHCVSRLLWPHFEGTLMINYLSGRTLISPGGGVEQLLMGKLSSTTRMTANQLLNYPINQAFQPLVFAARDVGDLKDYAYRDDSLLYWNAIGDWVKEYVELFYADDAKVQADAALQAWCAELVSNDGGRVVGFGELGRIQTRDYLIQALTMIIFTSSVQHAAVNFPQLDLMTYAPNMPGACYGQFPKAGPATEQDYLDMLPPLHRAAIQMQITYQLGSNHYTELGQYPANYFSGVGSEMLRRFQTAVADAGTTITARNQERRPYRTLEAGQIPQSINV